MKIKLSEIEGIEEVCVYCYRPSTIYSCCGENHSEKAYLVGNECYLDSEVTIIDDTEEVEKERNENLKLDLELGK